MLKNYKNFQIDNLFESVNESKFYLSPDFRKLLGIINSDISNDLINHWGTDIKPDLTFIDVDAEPGYITFGTMNNFLKKNTNVSLAVIQDVSNKSIVDRAWEIDKDSTIQGQDNSRYGMYRDKSRNTVKLGRLVNKVFPKKYIDKDVEQFVNDFKSNIKNIGERWELVSGEDIKKWYNGKMYSVSYGSLGGSCMRNSPSSYFTIFSENPEVCRMLLLTEDGKLIGRALIWKVGEALDMDTENNPVELEYFMDRQYTTSDADIVKFRNYALKQGWGYKARNHHSSLPDVIMPNGVKKDLKLKINTKPIRHVSYPYMDTFKRYDPRTGVLENTKDRLDGHYIIEATDGSYIECNGVYSEYYGDWIPTENAVRSEYLNDWIRLDRSVELGVGRYTGQRIPNNHRRLKRDVFRNVYLTDSDATFSDHYGYYIFSDDARNSILTVANNGSIGSGGIMSLHDANFYSFNGCKDQTWFKALSDKYRWGDYKGIHVNNLTSDGGKVVLKWDDRMHNKYKELTALQKINKKKLDMIPKILVIDLYGTTKSDKIEYLSEVDSYILKIPIDKSKHVVTDIISYTLELKDKDLTRTLTMLINKIKAQIKSEEEDWRANNSNDGSYNPETGENHRFPPQKDELGNYVRQHDKYGNAVGGKATPFKVDPMQKKASERGETLFW